MEFKKVLIIDDDRDFCNELKEYLLLSNYDATVINDSKLALDAARAILPDVILLDIKMEDEDGFVVAQKLKGSPETSAIPIIVITGYFNAEEDLNLMKMCGIKYRLNKPVNPVDIISSIEMLFNRQDGLYSKEKK